MPEADAGCGSWCSSTCRSASFRHGLPERARAASEAAVLSRAAAVVTTSDWTRRRLLDRYALDPARAARGRARGRRRRPGAGHDRRRAAALRRRGDPGARGTTSWLAALAQVADLPWRCACAGALDLTRPFVRRVSDAGRGAGIADRVRFVGALEATTSTARMPRSDLLVLASRIETYGMVVTEALAHGLPVRRDGQWAGSRRRWVRRPTARRPGTAGARGRRRGLAAALRAWLSDVELRERLRRAALSDGSRCRRGP